MSTSELDVKLDKFRLVKQMHVPNDIKAVIVLKNGALAIGTYGTVFIYKKDNIFKPDITIKIQDSANSLLELPDGSLVAGAKGLFIWTFNENFNQAKLKGTIKSDNDIDTVLLLPDERLVFSFTYASNLLFFKSTAPYSDTPIHKIETKCNSMLTYIKERNELLAYDYYDNSLCSWNASNYQLVKTIKLEATIYSTLTVVDRNTLAYGYCKEIFSIDLDTGTVEKLFESENIERTNGKNGLMLRDGHTMLVSGDHLCCYDFKSKTYQQRTYNRGANLNIIIKLDNRNIMNVGGGYIEWWRY